MQFKTAILATGLSALASAQSSSRNLSSLLSSNGELSGLAQLLNSYPNISSTLTGLSNVTIFAPNNQAFQNVGSGLNIADEDITNILNYHVVNGTVGYSSDLENGTTLQTLHGNNLTITIRNGTVFVNAARVVTPNVLVANGVIHIIDQ